MKTTICNTTKNFFSVLKTVNNVPKTKLILNENKQRLEDLMSFSGLECSIGKPIYYWKHWQKPGARFGME